MARFYGRNFFLAAIAGVVLAACGEDGSGTAATSQAPTSPSAPSQIPANVVPTISGTPVTTIVAGTTYIFQTQAVDGDSDSLTFSASGLPGWATLNSQTGSLSGTPAESDVGTTADIAIAVSDGEASAALPTFRISISSALPPPATPPPATNHAPTIAGAPAASVTATQTYSFTPSASDSDGQALTFSVANLPAWAGFSTSTGRVTGTPTTAQVRTYSGIVITASDGALSASLPAFSITVNAAPNRSPTISGSPVTSATAGTAYSFTPAGTDPDGQALTYSVTNKPSWAAFNTATGRLSGTPASGNVGSTAGIVISVSDGALSASLAAFTLTVNAIPNTAPTISGTPSASVMAGAAYGFTPVASDADGDALSFSIAGKPAWAVFSTATGTLSGTPTSAQAGAYSNIVITVSDGKTTRSLTTFTITVTQPTPTGSATLSWNAPTQNTDGSALTNLAGYRIHHGTTANSLTDLVDVPGATATGYTWNQLSSGTHYFAVSAYTADGIESVMSAVGSKAIP